METNELRTCQVGETLYTTDNEQDAWRVCNSVRVTHPVARIIVVRVACDIEAYRVIVERVFAKGRAKTLAAMRAHVRATTERLTETT